ncbi:bifunctional 4-hydroxy-2-oxoglutarate aldolase/2-dehydro-3-deoxy-phosphogluconate aldolase [Arthrobacter dokdonensis]|uniref:bifunctional 4-hydroxy-2-oxoglutarate aldolase/2-dehydro-3-deoxy-phosphogluconate aldolase n=1 Tax=Arthrobacter dokdonellae TaxID=2211210 RepID=UPI001D1313A1|nr:bifunctional 4-hydroxy-2-oxoglutarate aldolase/2-dehydro-3-deoxy-phosphogluconate aldolase [Arthrobacter dokdonellae]
MSQERMTRRPGVGLALRGNPVVAVLRASHASEYAPVIEALAAGGVTSIELTLSTEGVFAHLPALVELFGARVDIGVGTITTAEQANEAMDAGAAFLVTPVTKLEVVEAAVDRDVPIFPGGLTPTELWSGWNAGATAVKVFPAGTVGPGYVGHLRGPFPDIEVIPSGGVSIEDAPAWIAAGALAVSLGGPLLGDAFRGGDLTALTGRAQRVTALAAAAVAARGAR